MSGRHERDSGSKIWWCFVFFLLLSNTTLLFFLFILFLESVRVAVLERVPRGECRRRRR